VYKQAQLDFENSVLAAQREVEDGIVAFIKSQELLEFNRATEEANAEAVKLAVASFKEGKTDFGRVFVVQTNLVAAQDQVVATRTDIALALVATYKALGGGWQLTDSEVEIFETQASQTVVAP
jgi:outer membrane protein TolC